MNIVWIKIVILIFCLAIAEFQLGFTKNMGPYDDILYP